MVNPLQHPSRDLDAVSAVWSRAMGAMGPNASMGARSTTAPDGFDGEVPNPLPGMADGELVALTDAVGQLVRDGQAMLARAAAEVAQRSPREIGKDGLAKRQGFLNPAHLVAAATGGRVAAAAQLIAVGTATVRRSSLTGEPLQPVRPHVAAALDAGSISIDAAAAITGMLCRVAPRADPGSADRVETILCERAADIPFDLLLRVIREAECRLDQDGVAPREEQLRADRRVSIRQDLNGMVHFTAHLDPETAAPVKAAIESIVTHMIRARSGSGAAGASDAIAPVVDDRRTIPQLQADALATIARHALGCSQVPAVSSASLVVRADLSTLVDGLGCGTIDGLVEPVSAGTLRRLAATAGIIPAVMGTESLPLDLGRTARLFTPAQRIALAERDGGCACCGLPVAYTEAHHIDWWQRDAGPTDLSNGVLLCPPCHTRMHEDGWSIRVGDGRVWFIPPPHVDAKQMPRPGGKARFGMREVQPHAA